MQRGESIHHQSMKDIPKVKRSLRSNFPDINRPSLGSIVWPQNMPKIITEESGVTHEGTYVTVVTQTGEMPGTNPVSSKDVQTQQKI